MFTRYLKQQLQVLFAHEQGNTLMIFGLSLLALVGATGSAVDMGRAQMAQSKLSMALDAAGLAAAATINTTDYTAEATKYFNANFNNNGVGAVVQSLVVTPNADNSILTLTATVQVPTTFMRVFGKMHIDVTATSEITRANKGLELVMVLDTTGSMAGQPIIDLRNAAHDLIDILYGDNETIENLWVGIIPFSQTVNIGSSRTSWLDSAHYAALPYSGSGWSTSWSGCIEGHTSATVDTSDNNPTTSPLQAYYWPDNNSYNDWLRSGNRRNCTLNSSCGPNKGCIGQAVTPLTASKTTVDNAISALTDGGLTHVNLGAVWGFRLLSPNWKTYWGGEMNTNDLPLAYDAELMEKAIVIMTDGENTIRDNTDTAYGYLWQHLIGSSENDTVDELNDRLETVCNNMKHSSRGIIVYTVAFRGPGPDIEALLEGCASRPEYYFDAESGADLRQAFRAIGDSLANLRISK